MRQQQSLVVKMLQSQRWICSCGQKQQKFRFVFSKIATSFPAAQKVVPRPPLSAILTGVLEKTEVIVFQNWWQPNDRTRCFSNRYPKLTLKSDRDKQCLGGGGRRRFLRVPRLVVMNACCVNIGAAHCSSLAIRYNHFVAGQSIFMSLTRPKNDTNMGRGRLRKN